MATKRYIFATTETFIHSNGSKFTFAAYKAIYAIDDPEIQAWIATLLKSQVVNITELEDLPEKVAELEVLYAQVPGGVPRYATFADLPATDPVPDPNLAFVYNDTDTLNGQYSVVSDAWTKTTFQPASSAEISNKADGTVEVQGAGLATGGGTLDTPGGVVSITVSAATPEEARAAASDLVALTPETLGPGVEARLGAFGIDTTDGQFVVKSADDFQFFAIDPEGVVNLLDIIFSLSDQPFDVVSSDGRAFLGLDEGEGTWRLSLNADRFEASHARLPVPAMPGVITDVILSEGYFQFRVDGVQHIGRYTGDEFAPVLVHGTDYEIIESDGRSWNVRRSNLASECDVLDPSGWTRANVEALGRTFVTRQRVGVSNTEAPGQPFMKKSSSDNESITDFYRIDWAKEWSLAEMIAAIVDLRRAEFGLARPQILHMTAGLGGQVPDKFLPEGASYTDGTTTVNAALVDGYSHFLWAANVKHRDEIRARLHDAYFGRTARLQHLTAVMSPEANAALDQAFRAEYRAQQDALGLGQRNIFWVSSVEQVDSPILDAGAQGLIDFCRANASGKDFFAGPGYPYPLDDRIHRTSWSNVALAEVIALAHVYVERFGSWEPLWLDPASVVINGNELSIQTNTPRAGVGDLQVETDRMPARSDLGFSLREGASDLLSSVSVSGKTITITASEALAGKTLSLQYAYRPAPGFDYANAPDGTVEVPQYSSCYGQVYMNARHKPVVLGNEDTVRLFLADETLAISA